MSLDLVRKYYNIFILAFLCIGSYHFMIYMVNNYELIINIKYLNALYYISNNILIISLLFLVYKTIKPYEFISNKFKYTPLILSIYPINKLLINILFLFKSINKFIIETKDIWSFVMISLILLTFLILKYGKMD